MYYLYKNGCLGNCDKTLRGGGGEVKKHIHIKDMSKMVLSWKRFIFYFITTFLYSGLKGTFREYSIVKNDIIVSRALLISIVPNYKFLPKGAIHICYCETVHQEQGHGYYPMLLKYLLANNPNTNFYMIIAEDNIPSIKGVERAGFVRCGEVEKMKDGSCITSKLY